LGPPRIAAPAIGKCSAWARRVVYVAAAAAALGIILQCGLAVAIGAAPNAAFWAERLPAALPRDLVERGAHLFRAELASGNGSLAAWVVEPSAVPAGTVLLLHGVRMDKRASVPVALAVCDAGYRAVLVDLPGHGESPGRYLTYGEREARDLSRFLDELQASGVQLGPVGVYGFSYGAAVAIDLAASDPRVRGVVAVSAFASLREVIRDYRNNYLPAVASIVPDGWFQQAVDDAAWFIGFDPDASAPIRAIGSSTVPTLLIHGDADTQVPLRHSQTLARVANGRAKLVVLHGGTHDSMPVDATRVIRDEAVAWFDAKLRQSAKDLALADTN
jgi:pimeloyl-ACP methyl ester carboxylesterase